jgi:hypothetical protein
MTLDEMIELRKKNEINPPAKGDCCTDKPIVRPVHIPIRTILPGSVSGPPSPKMIIQVNERGEAEYVVLTPEGETIPLDDYWERD